MYLFLAIIAIFGAPFYHPKIYRILKLRKFHSKTKPEIVQL